MIISRLRTDKIEDSLHLIQEFIPGMKEIADLSKTEFLSDRRNPAVAEPYLRRAFEAILGICRHILARGYGFKDLDYDEIEENLARE